MEAIAAAEAEVASFGLVLQEGWKGNMQSAVATLETAMQALTTALGKFERIAEVHAS